MIGFPVRMVVLDIEGTVSPLAFVHEVSSPSPGVSWPDSWSGIGTHPPFTGPSSRSLSMPDSRPIWAEALRTSRWMRFERVG